jgi:hypothetical protein
VHEADAGDVGFDYVDFLQRSHNQQLQIQAAKQFETVARRFVGAAAECLVNNDEAEGAGPRCVAVEAELVSQTRSQKLIPR